MLDRHRSHKNLDFTSGMAEWQTHQIQNLTKVISCGFKFRCRQKLLSISEEECPAVFFADIKYACRA